MVLLKSDKKNEYFIWRGNSHLWSYLAKLFWE